MIINSNRPTFFGDDGEPLKLGYIYVGIPDQDPEEFPKEVTFIDSNGGEFTASQPLRTNSDGRIAYNGRAIKTDVDGNYSLLIKNSSQATIKDGYLPNVEELTGGSGGVDLDSYRKYYANLSTLKNDTLVEVGQTVGNLGLLSSLDGEGNNWIVINATGSPGNDIDLIDFSNGLQGRKLPNFLKSGDISNQPMAIWTGSSTSVTESDIEIFSGFILKAGVYLFSGNTSVSGPFQSTMTISELSVNAQGYAGVYGTSHITSAWISSTRQFLALQGINPGSGTQIEITSIEYVGYI